MVLVRVHNMMSPTPYWFACSSARLACSRAMVMVLACPRARLRDGGADTSVKVSRAASTASTASDSSPRACRAAGELRGKYSRLAGLQARQTAGGEADSGARRPAGQPMPEGAVHTCCARPPLRSHHRSARSSRCCSCAGTLRGFRIHRCGRHRASKHGSTAPVLQC